MDSKQLGDLGEKIACYYLEKKGYKVLERNYLRRQPSASKGEIDIIIEKDNIISFVEVKTLTLAAGEGFAPEDKVNLQKQRKLINLAQIWLQDKKISLESKWQIDVVSIKINLAKKKAKIRHLRNVVAGD